MSNKKNKNSTSRNTSTIKVIDNKPKIWCEYCIQESHICKEKCLNKK